MRSARMWRGWGGVLTLGQNPGEPYEREGIPGGSEQKHPERWEEEACPKDSGKVRAVSAARRPEGHVGLSKGLNRRLKKKIRDLEFPGFSPKNFSMKVKEGEEWVRN